MQDKKQTHYARISLLVSVIIIGLKMVAYWFTNSVGLLSDALESLVNVIGAGIALWMLWIASLPPDDEHAYGHSKAEYFSSAAEGMLIMFAAVSIAFAAIERLFHPQPLEQVGLGVGVSLLASLLNLGTALYLFKAAKAHHSISLKANAHHLMTDVWTSVGVLVGIGIVVLTGWQWLDPAIGLIMAVNIIWTGYQLVRESALGLMDTALPKTERQQVESILKQYAEKGIQYHALRTRQAGARKFISVHVLVPGDWTVHRGHQLLEQIEAEVRATLPNISIFTHLESLDDEASWHDMHLDREDVFD